MSKNAVDRYIDDVLSHRNSQVAQNPVQSKICKLPNIKKVEKTIIDKTYVVQIKVEYYPSTPITMYENNSIDLKCLGEHLDIFNE